MKLPKFRYPKLALLIICIIAAYIVFNNESMRNFILSLGNLGYLGIFIAGMLFSFGFTAPFAVGFFIVLHPDNILLNAIIAGCGSVVSDLLIFQFIRISFMKEFNRLKKTKLSKEINLVLSNGFSKKIKLYLLYVFAGIIIASPLPDEIGVTMLAGLTKIRAGVLGILSFMLNGLGIFAILYFSNLM